MDKKRVLFIAHSSNSLGGGEIDFIRLLKYFSSKFIITGVFPGGKYISEYKRYVKDYIVIPNVMLPFTDFNLKLYLRFIIKSVFSKRRILTGFLDNQKFDLVYIHSSVCYYEFLLLKKLKLKTVIVAREIISPKFLRRFIYKDYLENSNKIICISNYVKNFFIPFGINHKIKVIPCAIEKITEPINDKNFSKVKELIMVGSIHPLKDQATVIKAIRLLNNKNIKLRIIGSVSDENYYNSLIESNKDLIESGYLTFDGELKRDEILLSISNSDAVIIASREEGFSLVFLEACALGKPVITTPVGIMNEVVKDSENGLLFDFGDSYMLKMKIEKLLENEKLFQKICSEAIKVAELFSIDKMLSEYEKVFDDLLSK